MEYYEGCLLLGALGDTLGFKNGIWEFYNCKKYNSIIKEFEKLGGYEKIILDKWYISDDTLLMIATAKGIINKTNKEDNMKKEFINCYNIYYINSKINRFFGNTTLDRIEQMINNEKISFSINDGGSGCAMRTMPIGLLYSSPKNINNLIYYSLINSLMTHTHPMGYMGGVTVALFTSFAIQKINPEKWIKKMFDIYQTGILIKILKKLKIIDIYYKYQNTFFDYWNSYYYLRFKNNKYTYNQKWSNLQYRHTYFLENFEPNKEWLGATGTGSVIYAYDSLLLAGKDFKKLLYLTCLSCGDSDTLGIIACSLYGAFYGYKHINQKLLQYIEQKDIIIKTAHKL